VIVRCAGTSGTSGISDTLDTLDTYDTSDARVPPNGRTRASAFRRAHGPVETTQFSAAGYRGFRQLRPKGADQRP